MPGRLVVPVGGFEEAIRLVVPVGGFEEAMWY
jgi:hypothetical protein